MRSKNFVAGLVAVVVLACSSTELAAQSPRKIKLATSGANDVRVGRAVAVDGTRVVIGRTNGAFLVDIETGAQVEFTAPPNLAVIGGDSVGISGDRVVVGNPDHGNQTGTVYVFDAVTGALLHRLLADDAGPLSRFGQAVAIHGNTIVVGADETDDLGTRSGSAYVFDGVSGDQLHKLLPSDGGPYDRFGAAVAVDGNLAVVGAPRWGVADGTAYSFDVTTGLELARFDPPFAQFTSSMGRSVDIEGTTAIVSNSGPPEAYLFDAVTGTWLTDLLVGDPVQGKRMRSVGISGNVATGVTEHASDDGLIEAYLFDVATGAQIDKIHVTNQPWWGWAPAVAIDGPLIVSGVQHAGTFATRGAAFVIDRVGATWYGLGGGMAGTTGIPSLEGVGSLQPGSEIRLRLTGAPPNALTNLVIGLDNWSMPALQGTLVPSLNIVVTGLAVDASGTFEVRSKWPQSIPPEQDYFFQAWTFDPAAPEGYSSSTALAAFTP